MSLKKTVSTVVNRGSYASLSQPSGVAVIKLPTYVQKHVDKLKKRDAERKFDVMRKVHKRGDTTIPVISSNKKEYNFYLGQIYNNKFPIPMISRYWMKLKSAGQKFTLNSYAPNPSLPVKLEIPPGITEIKNDLQSMAYYITEFSQLNLSEAILNRISSMGYHSPTPIQALTIPKIMDGKNLLCIAETGCGKTMSYLIPIIHNLVNNKNKRKRFPETPLALIVVPGRELAQQIANVAHTFAAPLGVSVKVLVQRGTEFEHLIAKSGQNVDLLVATFGVLYKLVVNGIFKLSHIQHLVLDEADTLLDDSFKEDMQKFLSRIYVKDPETLTMVSGVDVGTQLILASSTEPKTNINGFEEYVFDKVVSPHGHRVLPHVSQKFIRVNHDNRSGVLLEIVKTDFKKKNPVIIFCNNSTSCDWVSQFLHDNDVPNAKFHAGIYYQQRDHAFQSFQSGKVDVLCCTDLASRGLDTQRAKHIVNFDFPNSMSDYILRVGRTGRIGTNHGHVTNLVLQKSGVYVVQDIEAAVRNSAKLQNVDANIKRKINKLFNSY